VSRWWRRVSYEKGKGREGAADSRIKKEYKKWSHRGFLAALIQLFSYH